MRKIYILLFLIFTFTLSAVDFERTVIGYSVRKRPIYLYRFGRGEQIIVLTAGTHGNEKNTTVTAYYLIRLLMKGIIKVPAGKMVYIIPEVNPDGLAAGTRVNANRVDINRNFATKTWRPNYRYYGRLISAGRKPFSEAESRVLRDFFTPLAPKRLNMVVVTLHSRGTTIIEASDDYFNLRLADFLRLHSPYDLELDYYADGALEDWLTEKFGIASATVEFFTKEEPDYEECRLILEALLETDIYRQFYFREDMAK